MALELADTVLVTVTGVVSNGTDTTGVFGSPSTILN
jgi:hypothetical protein